MPNYITFIYMHDQCKTIFHTISTINGMKEIRLGSDQGLYCFSMCLHLLKTLPYNKSILIRICTALFAIPFARSLDIFFEASSNAICLSFCVIVAIIWVSETSGAGCSKLMTSLVNVSLMFQM